jgi:hypothetical protein
MRTQVAKKLGAKPRRVSDQEWEDRISRKMIIEFAHSGDTLAAGYDAEGVFVACMIGHWTKANTQRVNSMVVADPNNEEGNAHFFKSTYNQMRMLGKRKALVDESTANEEFSTFVLGFKRQKTQPKADLLPGQVRMVTTLGRWYYCRYTRTILLLAALIGTSRAHDTTKKLNFEGKLVRLSPDVLVQVVKFL